MVDRFASCPCGGVVSFAKTGRAGCGKFGDGVIEAGLGCGVAGEAGEGDDDWGDGEVCGGLE